MDNDNEDMKVSKQFNSSLVYYLDLKVDGKPLAMKIDSGCHSSIISKYAWEQIGSPQLSPTTIPRFSATGARVELLGQFIANVEYRGRAYKLLLQVSTQPKTRNLIGRHWFPFLNLNWNRIFHGNWTSNVIFLELTANHIHQQHALLSNLRTQQFFITVEIGNVIVKMMLDTGATQTKIGTKDWERIGKPPLTETQLRIIDTANEEIPLEGQCSVMVKYKGEEKMLPVIVTRGEHGMVIGTNWFKYIRFDFNSIFENIAFHSNVFTPLQPLEE